MKKKLFPTRRPEPGVGQASACHAPARRSPRGFTLVELLVVIGIIGLLAGLLTPAVMRALASSRNAAIKAEIDMLHMAIMNYKSDYGSFPPCYDATLSATSFAGKHLARLFPRCTGAVIPAQLAAAFPTTASPKQINTGNAITYWLSGYTDDPQYPLSSSSSTRKKLFDFDMSRVNQVSGWYFPSGKSNSPYLYYNSSAYAASPYAGGNSATPGAMRTTVVGDTNPFGNTAQPFANPDTFQILCAGRDEVFGTDDDLSNFWPGTRQDYLDSLK